VPPHLQSSFLLDFTAQTMATVAQAMTTRSVPNISGRFMRLLDRAVGQPSTLAFSPGTGFLENVGFADSRAWGLEPAGKFAGSRLSATVVDARQVGLLELY